MADKYNKEMTLCDFIVGFSRDDDKKKSIIALKRLITPFPLKNRCFWNASNCTSPKVRHRCFPNRLATSCTTSTLCP